jgi:hypothetical protein
MCRKTCCESDGSCISTGVSPSVSAGRQSCPTVLWHLLEAVDQHDEVVGIADELHEVVSRSTGHAFIPTRRQWRRQRSGRTGTVPTHFCEPFDGIGTQLCPCTFAMATPQAFTLTPPTGDITQLSSVPPDPKV